MPSALLGEEKSPVTSGLPKYKGPTMWNLDAYFAVSLNQQLNKQPIMVI